MFLSFPFSLGFGFLCVFGTLLSVSSTHWLGVWFGLEINLLGFVPLIVQNGGMQSVEGAIKYFIIQALASGFLLLGGFSLGDNFFLWFVGNNLNFMVVFILFGLLMKLGVAPFHWWVPSVMGGMSWFVCGVMLTWQKLAPFFILISLSYMYMALLVFFGVMSSLVGGFMGIGQVQLRFLMAYSSIAHWGWIVSLMGVSFVGSVCYYIFYFLISVGLFYFLVLSGFWRTNNVSFGFFFVVIGFLSIAGLPPLSGFIPKLVGLQVLADSNMYYVIFFLIFGSLLSLYYYLSFLFVIFLVKSYFYYVFYIKSWRFSIGFFIMVFCFGFPFYEVLFFCLYAVGLFY